MNELAHVNEIRRREVEALRDDICARRASTDLPAASESPMAVLSSRITDAMRRRLGRAHIQWEVDILERPKFGADLAVRLTGLLKEVGPKQFIADYVPQVVEALESTDLADVVESVATKGIYVNVRLRDEWYRQAVARVVDLDSRFGTSDALADRAFLVDYSSPNVAKVLHAGHLRSTMIGHVLCNLCEACGALVYRVNHINDFGGFGFNLEGWRRFADMFPAGMAPNDKLLTIYAVRRTLERAGASRKELAELGEEERALVATYFPEVDSTAALLSAFDDFVARSDARFEALEDGDPDEVALWQQMVEWSLADFAAFYDALGIHIDFTIGESFYLDAGNDVIETAIDAGTAYELTEAMVDEETASLDAVVAREEMTPEVRDKAVGLLRKDLGAIVVPLPDGNRLVVRRPDGRSIYATRDLGAIALRRDIFDPTHFNYVVGQEQRVHFQRLFASSVVIGLSEQDRPSFVHTFFGFYVDRETGAKLSSRDSVSGVNELLNQSIDYFAHKTALSGDKSDEEIAFAARQLALSAVIFNDLKRDMKGSVPIAREDLGPTIAAFEKSGGPYLVYSACRARAILRKYGKELPAASSIDEFDVNDHEALLVLRLAQFPEKVVRAAVEDNPTLLVRHLLDIAELYNTYYAVAPVLRSDGANEFRLLITKAVETVLVNGMRMFHVECPPRI